MNQPPLLLYDGTCGLCHAAVRFMLRHEASPQLHFAPLESDKAKAALAAHGLSVPPAETLVVVSDAGLLTHSAAVLFLARQLKLPWRLAGSLSALPSPWLDALYKAVAARRHRFFKRPPADCPLVPPEHRHRFH